MNTEPWSPAQVMCRVCERDEDKIPASARRLIQAAALVSALNGHGRKIDLHTDDAELAAWALGAGGTVKHFAPHSGRSWSFDTIDLEIDGVTIVLFVHEGVWQ